MEITTRTIGKCKVLDCSGTLTRGIAAETLRKAIREAVQDDTLKVVLNLSDVPYADPGGLGEVVSGYVHVKNQGGKLILLNLSKKIQDFIAICKLEAIFQIYDDEQKALEGCE